jgi:succinate-semialdehyde dehydrogenase/glutarate-semialdehyde dehydrogenase
MLELADKSLLRDKAWIGGAWCSAADGSDIPVLNPATGNAIGHVPDMRAGDTRTAIEAAEEALPQWRGLTANARTAALRRWHGLIVDNAEDLARLMTAEQGKPLAEARGEIAYAASFVEWFAEEGKRIYGDLIPAPTADRRILTLKQPIGVVAAITPWNFPAAMITRKIAPALAAGCTAVVKPAEDTPLTALALAELAARAQIPGGVLNVVTTAEPADVGSELCTNPTVRKLSFTGSTAVGKLLMQQCAGTVKKVSLELGGNAPFIVFDDADIDAAVDGAIASKYRNAGQTCVCANRFLVHDTVFAEFSQRLAQRVGAMKIGRGDEDGVDIGPLINSAAADKVARLVDDAVAGGAKALTGGRRPDAGSNYYEPTVLTDVSANMAIAQEEIFGPVAPLYKFGDEADAIAFANDTPYGLAAYFYARDVGRIWRVAEALDYGIVGINEGIISTEVAPFGGMKESGIGREGSRYGIDEYVEIKYVCLGGIGT